MGSGVSLDNSSSVEREPTTDSIRFDSAKVLNGLTEQRKCRDRSNMKLHGMADRLIVEDFDLNPCTLDDGGGAAADAKLTFPPPPKLEDLEYASKSRLCSFSATNKIKVASPEGSICSLSSNIVAPSIGPNFLSAKSGGFLPSQPLSRMSCSSARGKHGTSHSMQDARKQQKLTLNAEKVTSLNLPPPLVTPSGHSFGTEMKRGDSVFQFSSPLETEDKRDQSRQRIKSESRLLAKRGETLPSISIQPKPHRCRNLPAHFQRQNSASSSKSAPAAIRNIKDSVHKELIMKATTRTLLTTDDIDRKIAFEKSRRSRPKETGLVGVLSEKIDSIRRANNDELDEDDSGYMDEWDEAAPSDSVATDLLSPTISEGLSPLTSPGIFQDQVAKANLRAYQEVSKAKHIGNGDIQMGKKSIEMCKIDEKRHNVELLLAENLHCTPKKDSKRESRLSIRTGSTFRSRNSSRGLHSVKEDDLLDAVEARVREVLQDWRKEMSTNPYELSSQNGNFQKPVAIPNLHQGYAGLQRRSTTDMLEQYSREFQTDSTGDIRSRIINYRPTNRCQRILASIHSQGEAAYYRNIEY